MNAKIYLHIGMQRTGTTFLQRNVFPNIRNINIVDFDRYGTDSVRNTELFSILCNIENYSYETVRRKVYRRFKADKINLISNENIYGRILTHDDKRFEKLHKIQQYFPEAKIIFGIRNKKDLALSWYNKYVQEGGVASLQDFLTKISNRINYEPYIKYLFRLFGKRNVYIYEFGNMKKDIHCYVKGICDFMGVKMPTFRNEKLNISYSMWQLKVALIVNQFFKTSLNPNGIIPLKFPWHLPHRIIFKSPLFRDKIRGQEMAWQNKDPFWASEMNDGFNTKEK